MRSNNKAFYISFSNLCTQSSCLDYKLKKNEIGNSFNCKFNLFYSNNSNNIYSNIFYDYMSFTHEWQTPFTHELVKRHLHTFFLNAIYTRIGNATFTHVFKKFTRIILFNLVNFIRIFIKIVIFRLTTTF